MLMDFSNKLGSDINECEFLILYNGMHQHLEDLHNPVNQYFRKISLMYNVTNLGMGKRSTQSVPKINVF